jgi:hypothetical protein
LNTGVLAKAADDDDRARRPRPAPHGSVLEAFRSARQLRPPHCTAPEDHGTAREWCRWPNSSPNAEASARHEPKPYVSPPPKSVRPRMTSPSYPSRRATRGPSTRPRASESKRAGSVRRWVSALLDFDPSVSPQGEAGGGEAAAKAPRWIKHDRGQSEPPQTSTANRSRPDGSNSSSDDRSPIQGRSTPAPATRATRQAGAESREAVALSGVTREDERGWTASVIA